MAGWSFATRKAVLMVILKIAKLTGLFAEARRLTARDLRILCCHRATVRDEHHFSPGLFMSKETLERAHGLPGAAGLSDERPGRGRDVLAAAHQDLFRKLFAVFGLEASGIEQARARLHVGD